VGISYMLKKESSEKPQEQQQQQTLHRKNTFLQDSVCAYIFILTDREMRKKNFFDNEEHDEKE